MNSKIEVVCRALVEVNLATKDLKTKFASLKEECPNYETSIGLCVHKDRPFPLTCTSRSCPLVRAHLRQSLKEDLDNSCLFIYKGFEVKPEVVERTVVKKIQI